jgi:hypothetical protein
MLGYATTDLDDMIYALDSVLTTINSDDDPWLYNNTWRAMELLKGLQVEGYFD